MSTLGGFEWGCWLDKHCLFFPRFLGRLGEELWFTRAGVFLDELKEFQGREGNNDIVKAALA